MDGICVGVSAIQNIPVGALVQYVQSLRDNYVKTFDNLVTLMLKLGSRCFVNSLIVNGILTLGIFITKDIGCGNTAGGRDLPRGYTPLYR